MSDYPRKSAEVPMPPTTSGKRRPKVRKRHKRITRVRRSPRAFQNPAYRVWGIGKGQWGLTRRRHKGSKTRGNELLQRLRDERLVLSQDLWRSPWRVKWSAWRMVFGKRPARYVRRRKPRPRPKRYRPPDPIVAKIHELTYRRRWTAVNIAARTGMSADHVRKTYRGEIVLTMPALWRFVVIFEPEEAAELFAAMYSIMHRVNPPAQPGRVGRLSRSLPPGFVRVVPPVRPREGSEPSS